MRSKTFAIALLLTAMIACSNSHAQAPAQQFVKGMDTIIQSLKIPGLFVALKIGDDMVVDTGLGWADVDNKVKVSSLTTFRVASVTKTFTSTIILQLVKQKLLNLDTPAAVYGIDLGNPAITVRHLLTHTSEGTPGTAYRYNGYRFGLLTRVIEQVTKKRFHSVLTENILVPLHMDQSAPGIGMQEYFNYIGSQPSVNEHFRRAFTNLASPYALDQQGKAARTDYYNEFGAFGGLVTNAHDLLLYSAAIDEHRLLDEQMQQMAFTPEKLSSGRTSPYGLGWFCQSFGGLNFFWHYGQTQGEGALFLKIPQKKLTLVVTANSERLSSPFPLGDGDIFSSPVAQLLCRYFLESDVQVDSAASAHLAKKILVTNAILSSGRGDSVEVKRVYQQYRDQYSKKTKHPEQYLSSLLDVGINVERSSSFTLKKTTRVKIEGVGEMCSDDGSSWCDYGWIENAKGKIVWSMQGRKFTRAGGAAKNNKVIESLVLPPGIYKLKYKSDGGHAFNSWDDLPPDNFTWGITVSNSQ